ncbi:unnamed protein product [Cylindrotheca closterium]|uniref:Glutamine amidotransferase domain-containing protein n=1 Tax=Cylindrotheca closterium TaxID=2856 RepID=A0AAD2CBC6_9STRA|nr:unnamed protein product [Cylindrotheca closterium]
MYSPLILEKFVGNGDTTGKKLELLFIGCEAKPPYGPHEHTANLFLQLIVRALESCTTTTTKVVIHVYSTSQGNYPSKDALEKCDGVILPGSFNSAYDEDEWVLQLKEWIQTELVAKERKTLGVCFGHQLYAHSYEQGQATKCGAGPQAGRKSITLTEDGKKLLCSEETSKDSLNLYYTHGDMVQKLPSQASKLGGNEKVPIQSAIYFANASPSKKPIAITFQAHPEFGCDRQLGMEKTLYEIMEVMKSRGDLSEGDWEQAKEDAAAKYEAVESDSIGVMIAVGKTFGWF